MRGCGEGRQKGISEKTILQIIQSKLQARLIVSTTVSYRVIGARVELLCNFESIAIFILPAYNDGLRFIRAIHIGDTSASLRLINAYRGKAFREFRECKNNRLSIDHLKRALAIFLGQFDGKRNMYMLSNMQIREIRLAACHYSHL